MKLIKDIEMSLLFINVEHRVLLHVHMHNQWVWLVPLVRYGLGNCFAIWFCDLEELLIHIIVIRMVWRNTCLIKLIMFLGRGLLSVCSNVSGL